MRGARKNEGSGITASLIKGEQNMLDALKFAAGSILFAVAAYLFVFFA